jgi:hypothetical protein
MHRGALRRYPSRPRRCWRRRCRHPLSLLLPGTLSLVAGAITFALASPLATAFGADDPPCARISRWRPAVVLQMVLIGATRGTGGMRAFVWVDQIVDGAPRY